MFFALVSFVLDGGFGTAAELGSSFPGARGHGSDTVGGRGGTVVIVDTLSDEVDDTDGVTSLREAVENVNGPRIIVFSVSGTIDTGKDKIKIHGRERGFVTIAGQTAPARGILLKGVGFSIADTEEVIIRYLKIRNIDPGEPDANWSNAINVSGAVHHLVIDHNSLSWATDQIMSFETSGTASTMHDVLVSNNIIAEGSADSAHEESDGREWGHSMGVRQGARRAHEGHKRFSFRNNIFVHHERRCPKVVGENRVNVVNNLIYNCKSGLAMTTFTDTRLEANVVGNVAIEGPNSSDFPYVATESGSRPGGTLVLYQRDNLLKSEDGSTATVEVLEATAAVEKTVPVFDIPGSYFAARDVEAYLSRTAGACVPARDAVDERLIDEIASRTGRIGISDLQQTSFKGEPRRYPEMPRRRGPKDTDRDGMPDVFEAANGLDLHSDDSDHHHLSRTFTNVEMYIESLGTDAAASDPLPRSRPEDPSYAFYEAESGRVSGSFVRESGSVASRGAFLLTDPRFPGPAEAAYEFDAHVEGVYYVWGRVFASDSGSNSFHVSFGPAPTSADADAPVSTVWGFDHSEPTWAWKKVTMRVEGGRTVERAFEVETAGLYQLSVRKREEGAQLDQLLITNDPDPFGAEGGVLEGAATADPFGPYFIRGDVNSDGAVDLNDSILLFDWFYNGDTEPRCVKASDVDDDGQLTLSDAVFLLEVIVDDSLEPKAPFPNVGADPTSDSLSCRS